MEKIKTEKHYVESVGIDVSKLTLDVSLYNSKKHRQFANSPKGFVAIQKLNKWNLKRRLRSGKTDVYLRCN